MLQVQQEPIGPELPWFLLRETGDDVLQVQQEPIGPELALVLAA